jgi:hypothetical protein
MKKRLTGAPDDSALVAVFFSHKVSGKPCAALATSPDSFAPAPTGKCVRININAFDDVAVSFKFCLTFLSTLYPLFPSVEKLSAIFKDKETGRIIFLPNPRNSDSTDVVVTEFSHDVASSTEITPEIIKAGGASVLETITIEPRELGQLIVAELVDYFSQPVSCGPTLLEHEALHIAGGIVQLAMQHQSSRDSPKKIP